MRLNAARLAPLTDAEIPPETAALLAPTFGRMGPLNIFRTMARHPKALAKFLAWGSYILSRSNTLPARDRELVILRTGFNCGSGYEWAQHVIIGKQSGLTDAEIARIKLGSAAPGWSAADAALLNATDDLTRDHCISNASWAALAAQFSQQQCMDTVYTVGQYTQVSMLLNSFGVQLDDGLVLDPDLDHRG